MKTFDTPTEFSHGLNYTEIPLDELLAYHKMLLEVSGGEESMIVILDNLIDNSFEDEAEELMELKEKLINYERKVRFR